MLRSVLIIGNVQMSLISNFYCIKYLKCFNRVKPRRGISLLHVLALQAVKDEGKSLVGKLLPLAHHMTDSGCGPGYQFSVVEEVRVWTKDGLMGAISVNQLCHLCKCISHYHAGRMPRKADKKMLACTLLVKVEFLPVLPTSPIKNKKS